VFNIGGTRFRLLTKIAYKTGTVLIERVGHARGIRHLESVSGTDMTSKVIRSQDEYQSALSKISALIDRDPTPDGPEESVLISLPSLVRDYESRTLSKVFV